MKKNDIIKQLLPGIIVGFILGCILISLVGVNETDPIPNYIGGAMSCLVPTILNTIIVLKGTAKILNRKLSIGKCFLRSVPYALLAGVIGFLIVFGFVENILHISTCEISLFVTVLYQATLGVVVSTIMAYIALKRYESQVKYTRRN